jgi:hypothetical protein
VVNPSPNKAKRCEKRSQHETYMEEIPGKRGKMMLKMMSI